MALSFFGISPLFAPTTCAFKLQFSSYFFFKKCVLFFCDAAETIFVVVAAATVFVVVEIASMATSQYLSSLIVDVTVLMG